MMLSALLGKEAVFESGNTVLVLDEIQECPEARTALKFFRMDGRYDVIGTGSLLGVKGYGKEPKSVPVGSETVIDMYPLDFEEFLWANAEFALTREIRNHFSAFSPMGKKLHEKALSQFRLYLIIGGMPAAIMEYKKERSSCWYLTPSKSSLIFFSAILLLWLQKEPPATAAMPGSRSLHSSAEPAVNSSTPALQKVLLPKSIMNPCSG